MEGVKMGCVHHWKIKDDEQYHQIGKCLKCCQEKDFGPNPTIVTDRYIRFAEDIYVNPFTGKLITRYYYMDRLYGGRYSKPRKGFAVPFEPSLDDESQDNESMFDRIAFERWNEAQWNE